MDGPFITPLTMPEPSISEWLVGFAMKSKTFFTGAFISIWALKKSGIPVSSICALSSIISEQYLRGARIVKLSQELKSINFRLQLVLATIR